MPPYYNTVPQGNQRISASQPQIQANFVSLEPAALEQFNKVTLLNTVGAAPIPAATQINMYNKVPAVAPLTTFQELFIKVTHGAENLDVPITAKSVYDNPTLVHNSANWFYLPSGLLVKYGTGLTIPGVYTFDVDLDNIGNPVAPHYAVACTPHVFYAVGTTGVNDPRSTFINFPIATHDHIHFVGYGVGINFYWLAIGNV